MQNSQISGLSILRCFLKPQTPRSLANISPPDDLGNRTQGDEATFDFSHTQAFEDVVCCKPGCFRRICGVVHCGHLSLAPCHLTTTEDWQGVCARRSSPANRLGAGFFLKKWAPPGGWVLWGGGGTFDPLGGRVLRWAVLSPPPCT